MLFFEINDSNQTKSTFIFCNREKYPKFGEKQIKLEQFKKYKSEQAIGHSPLKII